VWTNPLSGMFILLISTNGCLYNFFYTFLTKNFDLYSLTSINCVVTIRGVADCRNLTDGRTDGRTSSVWATGAATPKSGEDPGGGAQPARSPLKLEKIWFFCVKWWFVTRNTAKIFAKIKQQKCIKVLEKYAYGNQVWDMHKPFCRDYFHTFMCSCRY
jgi:hypothetical protein